MTDEQHAKELTETSLQDIYCSRVLVYEIIDDMKTKSFYWQEHTCPKPRNAHIKFYLRERDFLSKCFLPQGPCRQYGCYLRAPRSTSRVGLPRTGPRRELFWFRIFPQKLDPDGMRELGTASDVLEVLSPSWSRYEESDKELKRLKETIDGMGVDKSSFRLAQLELSRF